MCTVTCNWPTIITKRWQRLILYKHIGCMSWDQLTLPSNARLSMNVRMHVLAISDAIPMLGWWWDTILPPCPKDSPSDVHNFFFGLIRVSTFVVNSLRPKMICPARNWGSKSNIFTSYIFISRSLLTLQLMGRFGVVVLFIYFDSRT